jgi:FKBP-type peptidyl-prolyl cis-trans isomerase FkpA
MKKILTLILLLIVFISGCNNEKKDDDSGANNEEPNEIFYAVGMYEARRFKQLRPSDAEVKLIIQGIQDTMKDEAKIDDAEYERLMAGINTLINERNLNAASKSKEDGEKYLADYKKKNGVKVTDSGLAYTVKKKGNGNTPVATDTVKVHYEGKLTDGTVFDSSKQRGEPSQFPLNGVIKGWTEGIQLIQEGGEIELVIPSELAYGDRQMPNIPAGSTLIFNVELIEIVNTNQ